ncbi:MAG: Gfo/Idh/MocA family oxidoreductase [Thermomicrobiales bacterium]|nr:Gfo/Idh/MocA family oxidoreductase [Thermomicrobiales bacterium]
MTVRWGLIGASDIAATRMLPAFHGLDGCEPRAVVSSSFERAQDYAQRNDIPVAYAGLDELLADPDIDAVYISTTNEQHRDQTIAAAAAGKHVLCEKPLALTVEDALAMNRACAEAGVAFGTNHHLRNSVMHRKIRDLVASGAIGRPLAARVFHAVYLPPRLQGWRITRKGAGGGVVLDINVHDADTLRFDLTDDPVEVTALTANHGMAGDGMADSAMAVLRFSSGLLAQTHDAFTVQHTRTGFEVHGEDGSLRCTEAMTQEPDGVLYLSAGGSEREVDFGEHEDLYFRSVRLFNDAVLGRGEPAATGMDGVWSLATALAAIESAESGRSIPVTIPGV